MNQRIWLVLLVAVLTVTWGAIALEIVSRPPPFVYTPEPIEPMVLLVEDGSALMFIEEEWVRMCRCPAKEEEVK